jgi:hypothetical protein
MKTQCKTPIGKLIERQALRCFNAKLTPKEFEDRMATYLHDLEHRNVIDSFALIHHESGIEGVIFEGVCVLKDHKPTRVTFKATFS